jgi:Fe2+ or Zn2+ uptake regulation protein
MQFKAGPGRHAGRRAAIAFLICDSCGAVVEADSDALRGSLKAPASEAQFSPRAQVLGRPGFARPARRGEP